MKLSNDMKLSLSREDMLVIQSYYAAEMRREPTDVELEVIAQTWSEHCKHRIFGARIEHTQNGRREVIDGLFKTYVREGFGIGIIASLAFSGTTDSDMQIRDLSRLFPWEVTRIACNKDKYLRRYEQRFIELMQSMVADDGSGE